MNITIREATESDVGTIMRLSREFAMFQGTADKFTNTEVQMTEAKHLFDCLIAENGAGEAIGLATYYEAYYTWVGRSLYLDVLYVKKSYRGQKVGSRLLEQVFAVAKQKRCQRVRWLVSHWNESAKAFYEKCGATISQGEYVCTLSRAGIEELDAERTSDD